MESFVPLSSGNPTNSNSRETVESTRFQMDQYENPYYLNSNDHAGLVLVSDRLSTASDFPSWRRSMLMALNVRNKLGFINGTISKSLESHRDFGTWSRCNDIVSTWLMNSVDKKIGHSLLYIFTAEGMWKSILSRFKQDDAPRIFAIEQKLSKIEQGSLDVTTYYTSLVSLWEEHKNYVELPVCTCGKCECDAAAKWEKLQQRSRVTKFLMGLNESYERSRRHILMLKLIPTIEEAFNMVTQDERHGTIKPLTRVDNVAFQASAPISFDADGAYIAAYNTVRPQKPVCTHCGHLGHTIQKCYRLHGFPPGYKTNTGGYKVNNMNPSSFNPRMQNTQLQPRMPQSQPRMPYDPIQKANTVANVYAEQVPYSLIGSYPYAAPPESVPVSAMTSRPDGSAFQTPLFTPQQLQQILSQYNIPVPAPETAATSNTATVTEHGLMAQASTSGTLPFPSTSLRYENHILTFHKLALSSLQNFLAPNDWIIDSGASSHVCSDLVMFRELVPVSSVTVTLPNGTQELSQGLMIGRGRLINNLYILETEQQTLSPSLPAVCSFSASVLADGVLWHQRLGHPSSAVLKSLVSLIPSLRSVSSNVSPCQICPLAKQKRLAYVSHNTLASKRFDLVHMDIWGPFSTVSVEGFRYWLMIVLV
ncbi:PREDICTED: uncharacterized protein LOC109126295 [Camelina sativa]|uniref:Uncharacterized protein LOC109126295 n=1 Tax=Camelina sativa TaxID=90675 RepID=A0ABM1QEP4_CAMSA|nr:PREDICTED: uncharacterized protein LOC109126295 [Camelina sativa]